MNYKFWTLIVMLGVATVFFALGCSDSNDNNPVAPTPSISVTAPAAGASWTVGTAHDITWTTQGGVDTVNIEYSVNNGTSWTSVASNVSGTSHAWTVPNTPASTCKVRVSDKDNASVSGSSGTFVIFPASIVGLWNGTDASIHQMELDTLRYDFLADSTVIAFVYGGGTGYGWSGTYVQEVDSVRFHITISDGQPVNENYAYWYHLNTTTQLMMHELSVGGGSQGQDTLYTITYNKQ